MHGVTEMACLLILANVPDDRDEPFNTPGNNNRVASSGEIRRVIEPVLPLLAYPDLFTPKAIPID